MSSIYELLFPFEKIKHNSRILIYGGGTTGQHYCQQIRLSNYCHVIGVVDKNYKNIKMDGVDLMGIDAVKNLDYDYIVIAMMDNRYNEEIIEELVSCGVEKDKIIFTGRRVSNATNNDINKSMRDFSLDSGERQTSNTIEKIRKDHLVRYEMVGDFLLDKKHLMGMDCFCGIGYGSYLLAEKLKNTTILGIDASREAIDFANKYYGRKNIFFSNKIYPCVLPYEVFDYVVSFESIEHVEQGFEFIESLMGSVKSGGYLFLSVPNEQILPHGKNPNRFHYRHYYYHEMQAALKDFDIIKKYGQNSYRLKDGIIDGILPENDMELTQDDGQDIIIVAQKRK